MLGEGCIDLAINCADCYLLVNIVDVKNWRGIRLLLFMTVSIHSLLYKLKLTKSAFFAP